MWRTHGLGLEGPNRVVESEVQGAICEEHRNPVDQKCVESAIAKDDCKTISVDVIEET